MSKKQVRICNVTEHKMLIRDDARQFGDLNPGQCMPVNEEDLTQPAIAKLVEAGWLVILKPGEKPPTVKANKHAAQTAISLIKEKEILLQKDGNAVSFIDEDPDDGTVPAGVEEGDGSLLIQRGGKGKPAKIMSMDAAKIAGAPKIIKTRSQTKVLNLDSESMGQMWVNPSGIPGQGKLVNISDLTDAQFASIREKTQQMFQASQRDRKVIQMVNNYQTLDTTKRKQFIEAFDDAEILDTMLRLEKSPALAMAIRSKIGKITGASAVNAVPKAAKPKPKAAKVKAANKPPQVEAQAHEQGQ